MKVRHVHSYYDEKCDVVVRKTLNDHEKKALFEEIKRILPLNKRDEKTIELFVERLDQICGDYIELKPGAENETGGVVANPTDQKNQIDDIIKALKKPAGRSPVDYLWKLATDKIRARAAYSLIPGYTKEELEIYCDSLAKVREEALRASFHIKRLLDLLEKERSRIKGRGRGNRLNYHQMLDRAVDDEYFTHFGKPKNKDLLTELKGIIREAVGEPCKNIRKTIFPKNKPAKTGLKLSFREAADKPRK